MRSSIAGDPVTREFIAFWLTDGRLAAGMNVNVWDVNAAIAAIVASHRASSTSTGCATRASTLAQVVQ